MHKDSKRVYCGCTVADGLASPDQQFLGGGQEAFRTILKPSATRHVQPFGLMDDMRLCFVGIAGQLHTPHFTGNGRFTG